MGLTEKAKEFKEACKVKYENFKALPTEEKVSLVVNVGSVVGGITYAIAKLAPSKTQQHDNYRAKRYYDPHTGIDWELKKKLNNNQKIELVERQERGEDTHDILRDMRVLK